MLFFNIIISILVFVAIGTAQQPTSKIIDAGQLLTDVKTLSADDMDGRAAGTPGSAKAREYIIKRFTESGVKPFGDTWTQEFDITRRDQKIKGTNVIGFIKGTKNPQKYVFVTAHYDHLGNRSGVIYNGADDNASGTAALFSVARYFSKHKPVNSVVFVAFDAEEMGLQGARYFVGHMPVKKEDVLIDLNMDMVSHSDKGELYAAGTFQNPQLKPVMESVVKKASVKLILGHDDPATGHDDWTDQSDQGAFHKEKIPYIYFGVEDHKDYHKPTDKFETITQEFYVHAVETVVWAAEGFDKSLK